MEFVRFVLLCLFTIDLCQSNDELGQISLLTYNVMFVPKYLVMERDQITRAHLLSRAKFLRSADILCLQEVFQPEPSEILLNSLTHSYPYSTPILGNEKDKSLWDETWNRNVGESSLKFVSAGLVILSKWPIVHAVQYFYEHSCSGHTFVRVGFIYVRIVYGNSKETIHVIGTHLQPDDHPACYISDEEQIRREQMSEIRKFLDIRRIPNDQLVFIVGDFNIDRHNQQQYEDMLELLDVLPQNLYSSSLNCTWHSSYNAMTHTKHHENQLLDYVFIHRQHSLNNSIWHNLVLDPLASEQWRLLGKNQMFSNPRNIPLMELSDHYPVLAFFHGSRRHWPQQSIGVISYVQLRTADTDLPVILSNRNVRIGHSSNESAAIFILTNNGTPRRHRCLKSDQFIFIVDAHRPEYFLSDSKLFRMKYSMEQANRYLKLIRSDNTSKCLENGSTFILESRLRTGLFYVNTTSTGDLCSCTTDKDQAQIFRFIVVQQKNVTCTITH